MHLTELEAVNFIRGSVGNAPVSTLTTTNPDVLSAQSRLNLISKEVQSQNWWFNTDLGIKLSPNASGEIIVPSSALEAHPTDKFDYLVVRGKRVYNPVDNTYQFDEQIEFDILTLLPFEDLPFVAANHIQYQAARKWQADYDGDATRTRDLREDANIALIDLNKAQQRNRPTNLLFSAGPQRMFRRVNPGATYSRNPYRPGG